MQYDPLLWFFSDLFAFLACRPNWNVLRLYSTFRPLIIWHLIFWYFCYSYITYIYLVFLMFGYTYLCLRVLQTEYECLLMFTHIKPSFCFFLVSCGLTAAIYSLTHQGWIFSKMNAKFLTIKLLWVKLNFLQNQKCPKSRNQILALLVFCIKGTVNITLSNLPCQDGISQFTTVSTKA